jgi:hypothetical protein
MKNAAFSELLGKTVVSVKGEKGDDRLEIQTSDGCHYALYHSYDCCESVAIEDITGDVADLIGEPLLEAEEVTSNDDPEGYKPESTYRESFTWTFYKLGTRKGRVTVRWLGESNGYYSESVDFVCMLRPSTPIDTTGEKK